MMASNIVITMAGRGSRFYEAGYTVPKYEIMAHGHSLFYWSMLSLKNFVQHDSRLIFICLAENDSSDHVRAECNKLGWNDVQIMELPQITDGQATSAYAARAFWQLDAPLLVYNIDTYVHPQVLQPEQIRDGSDGWIPCFRMPGDHWSFVKLGEDEWATDVVEKKRISDHASVGLYWFARAGDFLVAYEEFFSDPANLMKGERYIAPLYQYFIRHNKKISTTDLPVPDVHVLGTPRELAVFLGKSPTEIL
jgi:dTDP-glucose pyrophosphorylase